MKRVRILVAACMMAIVGAFALVPAVSVSALDPLAETCKSTPDSQICQSKSDDASKLISNVINTLLFVVGSLSVVMIIVGGVLYTVSSGDSGKVSKAKNTITYAVVGLVVSLLAYAIVGWVMTVIK